MFNFASSEDVAHTNAFLDELEDLMTRYGVWMHVAPKFDADLEDFQQIIEIQSLEDVDSDNSEVNWFLETDSLWPGDIARLVDVEERRKP